MWATGWTGGGAAGRVTGYVPLELAGLFLLLPPALMAPTLSLLWGGDYFFAIRHTVAASLVMPALLPAALGVPLLPASTPEPHSELVALEPALLTYGAVLVAALFAPGCAAQVLRRRDPIRAGALSTNWNWNWLGCLALSRRPKWVAWALWAIRVPRATRALRAPRPP
ncbi:hypothetical protein OK074_5308 [Actinobacteria bacterium OK074]|nr:hypothetical protein OK074_5308 [Actinobacteria bacterium OK074]